MNASLPRRIEIAFWVAAIKVMQDRRSLYYLPSLLLSSCLLVTMLVALSTGVARSSPGESSLPVSNPPAIPAKAETFVLTGQINVLLIGVDDLARPVPQLEGVWLLLYIPSSSNFTLLPIYPAAPDADSGHNLQLRNAFRLQADLAPDPAFLDKLSRMKLWWNNYVLVDRKGLEELARLSATVQNSAQPIPVLPLPPMSNQPDVKPQAVLSGQMAFLKGICQQASWLSSQKDPVYVFNQFASDTENIRHLKTDFSPEQIVTGWSGLRMMSLRLSCEFPTMQTAGIKDLSWPTPELP